MAATRGRNQRQYDWRDDDALGNDAAEVGGYDERDDGYGPYDRYAQDDDDNYAAQGDDWYAQEDERGLVLQPEQSLVGVSHTVTHHGVPLLSYTRTMNRFYTSRKQRLSLGRYKCEVCGDRIRWWAWETDNGSRTHDGCYERLAWTWTSLYAQQQRLAAEGHFNS